MFASVFNTILIFHLHYCLFFFQLCVLSRVGRFSPHSAFRNRSSIVALFHVKCCVLTPVCPNILFILAAVAMTVCDG